MKYRPSPDFVFTIVVVLLFWLFAWKMGWL